MKRNKLLKRLIAALETACLCAALLVTPAVTLQVQAQIPTEEPGINPYSDFIEWAYDVFDGKLYKRLYNHSTGEWIGDWIYVRDWDGPWPPA